MEQELYLVKILGVIDDKKNNGSVVILHNEELNLFMPIIIGINEATMLSMILHKIEPPRPLTHNLISTILDEFEVTVKEVLISRAEKGIYYAELVLDIGEEEMVHLDARPSDAIILAMIYNAPVYVEKNILESSSYKNPFELKIAPTSRKPRKLNKEDVLKMKKSVEDAIQREKNAK